MANMIIGSVLAALPATAAIVFHVIASLSTTKDPRMYDKLGQSASSGLVGYCCNCWKIALTRFGIAWRERRITFLVIFGLCWAVTLAASIATSGFCICFFAPGEGGLTVFNGTITVSTWLTRKMLTPPCGDPNGTPCHVFLTLPEITSEGVFVNVQVPPGAKYSYELKYWPSSSNRTLAVKARYSMETFGQLEAAGQRTQYTFWVRTKIPRTRYSFEIEWKEKTTDESPSTSPIHTFVSLPAPDDGAPIDFVFGGDVGSTNEVELISAAAGALSPAFAVVGGDVAYDNGWNTCYRTWDACKWC